MTYCKENILSNRVIFYCECNVMGTAQVPTGQVGDLCPYDDEHDNHGQCHDDHEDLDHDDQAPGGKL